MKVLQQCAFAMDADGIPSSMLSYQPQKFSRARESLTGPKRKDSWIVEGGHNCYKSLFFCARVRDSNSRALGPQFPTNFPRKPSHTVSALASALECCYSGLERRLLHTTLQTLKGSAENEALDSRALSRTCSGHLILTNLNQEALKSIAEHVEECEESTP